jgi:hypothetical protein
VVTKKQCTKCKKRKNADVIEFPPHPKSSDGLGSWCRSCSNINSALWRQAFRARTGKSYEVALREAKRAKWAEIALGAAEEEKGRPW